MGVKIECTCDICQKPMGVPVWYSGPDTPLDQVKYTVVVGIWHYHYVCNDCHNKLTDTLRDLIKVTVDGNDIIRKEMESVYRYAATQTGGINPKIVAIKALRDQYNMGLKDAKYQIEAWIEKYSWDNDYKCRTCVRYTQGMYGCVVAGEYCREYSNYEQIS